jgi:aminotransferase EvaB
MMSAPVIPMNDLRRGYDAMAAELGSAVTRVLESGWYVHGPEHAAFEAEFAAFVGTADCVGVGNGTQALELAVRAVQKRPHSVVVTAANAGMYSTTAIRRAGRQARYADVDPSTLLLTADTISAVLDDDVSAVIVTHLYGRLADIGPILDLCRRQNIALIEDCAQAVGASSAHGNAGSFGDAAAFSFYPTKNLGALGDAGAVTTSRDDVARELRALRQYGWTAKYSVQLDGGGNSRLDELQAAVLRTRLPHVQAGNATRRAIIGRYAQACAGTPVAVLGAPGPSHAGHLAVARAEDRAHIRTQLLAAGVQTDVHYPIPDHRQPLLAEACATTSLPVTERVTDEIFSLPCFPELTDDEVTRVCTALASL